MGIVWVPLPIRGSHCWGSLKNSLDLGGTLLIPLVSVGRLALCLFVVGRLVIEPLPLMNVLQAPCRVGHPREKTTRFRRSGGDLETPQNRGESLEI